MSLYRKAASLMPEADPLLELGTVYYRQGDAGRARECWKTAMNRPGGEIHARISLLSLYGSPEEAKQKLALKTELLNLLSQERTTCAARWRAGLAAAGVEVTDEEIDALLLLNPDLTDPMPLQREEGAVDTPPQALANPQ
jgi:lipopolysaccharide biosynthesis regulator YciM